MDNFNEVRNYFEKIRYCMVVNNTDSLNDYSLKTMTYFLSNKEESNLIYYKLEDIINNFTSNLIFKIKLFFDNSIKLEIDSNSLTQFFIKINKNSYLLAFDQNKNLLKIEFEFYNFILLNNKKLEMKDIVSRINFNQEQFKELCIFLSEYNQEIKFLESAVGKFDNKCPLCGDTHLNKLYNKIHKFRNENSYQLDINVCTQCKFTFLQQAYSSAYEELSRIHYSTDKYNVSALSNSSKMQIIISQIKRFFSPTEKIKILEIGSATGMLLKEIKKEFPNSEIICIEPNNLETDVFTINSFYDENIFSNKFDFIVMQQVFEHLTYPIKYLNSFKKLLTSKGVICIEVPYVINNMKYCVEDFSFEHVSYFSKSTIVKLANEVGIDIVALDDSKFLTVCFSNGYKSIEVLEDEPDIVPMIERFNQNKNKLIESIKNRYDIQKIIFYGVGRHFMFLVNELEEYLKNKELYYFDDAYTEDYEMTHNLPRAESLESDALIILSTGDSAAREKILEKIKNMQINAVVVNAWEKIYDFTQENKFRI